MSEKKLSKPPAYKTPEGLKLCGRCQIELPANTDFFDADRSKADGFKGWCKRCRKEYKQGESLRRAAAILDKLDNTVVENLAKARPGGSAMPHALEIYQNIMALLGGPQGFAMHWAANFAASKPGSASRERMLGKMQDLAVSVSENDKVSKTTEQLSTEELEAELARREAEMTKRTVLAIQAAQPPEPDFDLPTDRSPHESALEHDRDQRQAG